MVCLVTTLGPHYLLLQSTDDGIVFLVLKCLDPVIQYLTLLLRQIANIRIGSVGWIKGHLGQCSRGILSRKAVVATASTIKADATKGNIEHLASSSQVDGRRGISVRYVTGPIILGQVLQRKHPVRRRQHVVGDELAHNG